MKMLACLYNNKTVITLLNILPNYIFFLFIMEESDLKKTFGFGNAIKQEKYLLEVRAKKCKNQNQKSHVRFQIGEATRSGRLEKKRD